MFSGSTTYSPGDNYVGQVRPATRDFVPSSWVQGPLLAKANASVAIAAGVALAVIFWLGRSK